MILAAAAALVLASCAKTEITSINEETVKPIGFSSYTPRSLSKAGETYVNGNAFETGKTFAVYSWSVANASALTATPGTPNFMNPAVVTWNNDTTDGDGNTYSPVRYWPAGDSPDKLSFTAYYPAGDGTGITAPTFSDSEANGAVGTYAFTAKSASVNMVDFCVADVVNDQVYGSTNAGASYPNTVKFTFKHQLAKIQFKFKKATGLGATTVIELVDAELSKINNTGTLKASYNASTHGTSTAWYSVSGTAGYEVTLNTEDPESGSEIVLSESPSAIDPADIFLMVPQNMAASTQTLTVTWKVKVYDTADNANANNGTGLLSETTNTKALSLFSDLVTSDTDNTTVSAINWEMNNFITYTITIGPKPIWFTGTVTGWDTEQDGYFNVN